MTFLFALVVAVVVAVAALVWWCLVQVQQIPGPKDPLGDLITAWRLAVAWVREAFDMLRNRSW